MKNEKASPRVKVISGWKDIARYLGKGVRTVQRYERELGLPVRRPAGKVMGAVMATKAELDAWIAVSPFRESFPLPVLKGDHHLALRELRRLTAETHRLRADAVDLRNSLVSSFQRLRSKLHTAVTQTSPVSQNRDSILSAPERRVLADVLTFDSVKKRAV